MELICRWTQHFTKIEQEKHKIEQICIWNPMTAGFIILTLIYVISMEFLSLSYRHSSSRNIPQRRWARGNVCHSQAKSRTAGAKEAVLIALNKYDGLLAWFIHNHLFLTMTVFYYVILLGSHQYLTVSSTVHSWLGKRWHLLTQGNRYNIVYLCYSSTRLSGTLRSQQGQLKE